MSCVENLNRFVIPNDVICELANVYKYIGRSENYAKIVTSDYNRIVSQTIERDTFFLAKMLNIDVTDNRLRLIISKNSEPKNRDEKILYSLKDVLTNFQKNPNSQKIETSDLLNLINYIFPKQNIKYDVFKDDRRNQTHQLNTKSKREILDQINQVLMSYEEGEVEPLILSLNYFIDIYSLKPLNEYNDALAYLVLYLMLQKSGILSINYVSIFEKIYTEFDEFKDSLTGACYNWNEGLHQILSFVRFFVKTIKELSMHCEKIISSYEAEANANKSDNIENTIFNLPNIFTKDEIRLMHPYVSESTINRTLIKLRDENMIKPLGKGRSAKWIKIGLK